MPAAARQSLASDLKRGRTLGKIKAVKSRGTFDGPTDLTLGVYFVSADVQPSPGAATWAFGARAFEGHTGIIVAADPAARAVSDLGVDAPVEGWGITPAAEGYEESRECVS